jgi:hypothetical protein
MNPVLTRNISTTLAGMVSIPLANIPTSAGHLSVGFSVPGTAIPWLDHIGLYDSKTVEKIAKAVFEGADKTLTGHWMDGTGHFRHLYPGGIPVGDHRAYHGHHFITDAWKCLKSPDLSVLDFYRHLATDIPTPAGLPLLQASLVESIASTLNVSQHTIVQWTSFNLLDVGGGVLAIWDSAGTLKAVLSGTNTWSAKYAMKTLGGGSAKVASGLYTQSPVIVGSGVIDVGCGIHTAVKHVRTPKICGVPIDAVLRAGLTGAVLGGLFSAISIAIGSDNPELIPTVGRVCSESAKGFAQAAATSIAVPLGVSVGLGLVGAELAIAAANSTNQTVKAMPIAGRWSTAVDQLLLALQLSRRDRSRINAYLEYGDILNG